MPGVKNLRRGLRPLSCPCGAKVYATWAQVEQHGLPIHGRCGEPHTPEEVAFALALGLETEEVREYGRRLYRFVKSQHSHDTHGHALRDPHTAVAAEFEQARALAARASRLNALRPAAEPMAF